MPRDLPPSAVSIYTDGDELWVQYTLPFSGQSAEISFRNAPSGYMALWRFLAERQKAFAQAKPVLFGTPAAPIQHIVDSWQRDPTAKAKAAKAAKRAEAERFKSKPVKEQLSELSSLFDDPNFEI